MTFRTPESWERAPSPAGSGVRSYGSTVDEEEPHVTERASLLTSREPERSTSYGTSSPLLFFTLLIFASALLGPLFGFLGVYIDRSLSPDPALRREWAIEREKHNQELLKYEESLERYRVLEEEVRARICQEEQRHDEKLDEYRSLEELARQRIREQEKEYDDKWEKYRGLEEAAKEKLHKLEKEHDAKLEEYRGLEDVAVERIRQKERAYDERVEWERRERRRLRLYWADVEPSGQCLGIGKRMHRGRLGNLESWIDGVGACKETPTVIDGVEYPRPTECEERGADVYGYWLVQNDPACATYWEYFRDKGCSNPGSGYHRWESHLGGVRPEDNPETMCYKTPATIQGHSYEGPMACPYWGEHGWWGIWDVPDNECR